MNILYITHCTIVASTLYCVWTSLYVPRSVIDWSCMQHSGNNKIECALEWLIVCDGLLSKYDPEE